MVLISLVAAFLARDPNSSVFRVVSFAWAGFGATFGPTMLLALFWKRSTKWGALAGMLVGGVMVFVWKFLVAPMGGVWAIYELLPAFLCACAAIVVVSLLTPRSRSGDCGTVRVLQPVNCILSSLNRCTGPNPMRRFLFGAGPCPAVLFKIS